MIKPTEDSPPRFHILLYLGSLSILTLLIIINLALHEWFEYCYFTFGLINASCTESKFNSGINSISDVKDWTCHSRKNAFEGICPDLCSNVDNFAVAGGLMIAFNIFTFLGIGLSLIMHVLLLCNKRVGWRFSWLFTLVPFSGFTGSFVIYCLAANTSGIKGVKNNDAHNFEWKGGMVLAVIISVFLFGNLVHGCFFTRKHLVSSEKKNIERPLSSNY